MHLAFTIPGFETLHEDELGEAEYTAHMNADYSNLNVHLKCFAHSINLVAREGIKNCREVVKLLSKTAAIVSFIRKSTVASELLDNEKRVQSNVVTR